MLVLVGTTVTCRQPEPPVIKLPPTGDAGLLNANPPRTGNAGLLDESGETAALIVLLVLTAVGIVAASRVLAKRGE